MDVTGSERRGTMYVYTGAVFLHVVAALGLFAALGLEWAGLYNLRRSLTTGQAREWIKLLGAIPRVGGPAALMLLLTGIYMSTARWGQQAWIGLGLVGLVIMAVIGRTLSGRRLLAIVQALPVEDGPVPPALRRRIADPVLMLSARVRTALGMGIVFIMSTKPAAVIALTATLLALVLGVAAGALEGGRREDPAATGSQSTMS